MNLLPDDVKTALPALYSTDNQPPDTVLVVVHYFIPNANWDWYAVEGSPTDKDGYFDTPAPKVDTTFFGYVNGLEFEAGYFTLSQLAEIQPPTALPVERDLHWTPITVTELKSRYQRN